jgi:hypothetical protein
MMMSVLETMRSYQRHVMITKCSGSERSYAEQLTQTSSVQTTSSSCFSVTFSFLALLTGTVTAVGVVVGNVRK